MRLRHTLVGRLAVLACVALPREHEAQAGGWSLPTIVLPPPIERVLRDYESAWRAGDGDRLADLFTTDGILLPSGAQPQRGRDAVAASRTRAGGMLELVAFAFAASDTVGYIVGGYRVLSIGPEGKFVLALRRAPNGAWRIAADMENGNGTKR